MEHMGQTDRKPIVIEFNGIPGSGKTTTAFEVKRLIRSMGARDIPSKRIIGYRGNYKEIILSKEIRNGYAIFLKAFFLIRPITWKRLRLMNMTFNYWLGIRKLRISEGQRCGVCVLDQGIVQAFVSMAYLGGIRNEEKYYRCIKQVMDRLDNVICVNCIIDTDISMIRMRTRRPNGGRLQQIGDDNELRELLEIQRRQFEGIREKSIKKAITINMHEQAECNAEEIVEYCKKYL